MNRDTRLTTLPMLVLRGLVCFPETVIPFEAYTPPPVLPVILPPVMQNVTLSSKQL